MASSYPSTFDDFQNPTASDKTNSATVPHATQHANLNDAVESLQHRLGLSTAGVGGSSYPSTRVGDVLMVNSTGGHTAWGQPSLGRNRLVNGDMRVWQRGTSTAQLSTVDNTYTADRWRLLTGGSGSGRVSRSTSVPVGGSPYSLKLWNDAAGSKNGIFQPVEGVNSWDCRGQAVSVQAKIRPSSTAVDNVRMAIVQSTAGSMDASSTGDPISAWNGPSTNPTLAAPWSYVNTPTNLGPSSAWSTAPIRIENQVVNSSAVNLGVLIWQDSTANSTSDFVEVTDVQLERGAFCTPFERRPEAIDVALAQRYYERIGGIAVEYLGVGFCVSTAVAEIPLFYSERKRATPTVGFGPAAADFQLYVAGGLIAATGISMASAAGRSAKAQVTVAGGLTIGQAAALTTINSSAYIEVNAEL